MGRLFEDGWIAFVLLIVTICCVLGLAVGQEIGKASAWAEYHARQAENRASLENLNPEVSDVPASESEGYVFDESEDLQNPELPTGCEATAMATVLRMNGVEVSKTEFADAMPKGSGEDFVHEFWGDPYSEHGFACMAPCVAETAKRFITVEHTVVDLTGTQLTYLPAPCAVWVTMHLDDPIRTDYEQDGYGLLWNTHCVVLLSCDEAQVTVIDPLDGLKTYPFSKFDRAYQANGRQAVYIAERGYTPELS